MPVNPEFFMVQKRHKPKNVGELLHILSWPVEKCIQKSSSQGQEERFVLGVVLEPNDGEDGNELKPDTDNEIYSADEVKRAAHWYMEFGKKKGLLHGERFGGEILDKDDERIVVVESYITPVDIPAGTFSDLHKEDIKKGTWLMGFKINDDKVWKDIKEGKLNGLSIGGMALQSELGE